MPLYFNIIYISVLFILFQDSQFKMIHTNVPEPDGECCRCDTEKCIFTPEGSINEISLEVNIFDYLRC